jgi:hypothetical protein
MSETDLVYRLQKRAEIRRQIPNRKSVQEGEPDRIADLLEEAANRIEQLEKNYDDDEKLVHEAWRNAESYQVPMTEQGLKLADARYYGFKRGWQYAKFYAKYGHTDMKEHNEGYNQNIS